MFRTLLLLFLLILLLLQLLLPLMIPLQLLLHPMYSCRQKVARLAGGRATLRILRMAYIQCGEALDGVPCTDNGACGAEVATMCEQLPPGVRERESGFVAAPMLKEHDASGNAAEGNEEEEEEEEEGLSAEVIARVSGGVEMVLDLPTRGVVDRCVEHGMRARVREKGLELLEGHADGNGGEAHGEGYGMEARL